MAANLQPFLKRNTRDSHPTHRDFQQIDSLLVCPVTFYFVCSFTLCSLIPSLLFSFPLFIFFITPYFSCLLLLEQGQLIIILTRLWAWRPGFDSRQRQGFFSSPPPPDRLWDPPQPLVQWALVPGLLFLEVKRLGRESNRSLPSSSDVNNAWSYTSTPPILLHGVMLN